MDNVKNCDIYTAFRLLYKIPHSDSAYSTDLSLLMEYEPGLIARQLLQRAMQYAGCSAVTINKARTSHLHTHRGQILNVTEKGTMRYSLCERGLLFIEQEMRSIDVTVQ
jgi:hypothetical protein